MARPISAPFARRSFSRLETPLEAPHLIDIQRRSFEDLTDTKTGMLRETINDVSPIEDYTGNLEEQNRQLRAERDGLQVELERKEQEIERLSYDLEAAQRNLRDLSSRLPQLPLESTQDQASGELSFDTVSDAVQHALPAFPDLLILDSALDSSEKVPVTYRFVGRVYEALRCLQLAANERNQNGRFKSGLKEYFKPLGFEYKRLSDTTKNSWGDEYTFLCEDVPVLFEEHFTIGVKSANTCISIHFSTRQRQDKIVVAYVGRHLRNTQS